MSTSSNDIKKNTNKQNKKLNNSKLIFQGITMKKETKNKKKIRKWNLNFTDVCSVSTNR